MCVIFSIHVLSAPKERETRKHTIEEEIKYVQIFILIINWICFKETIELIDKYTFNSNPIMDKQCTKSLVHVLPIGSRRCVSLLYGISFGRKRRQSISAFVGISLGRQLH